MASLVPDQEGDIPFKIPNIDKPCFTHYKIFGDIHSGSPTVVLRHGGPGAGHEYLLPFAELYSLYGLPCVFYDHIGCGASTHLPETAGDESFWQEQLFTDELDNLLDQLKLRDGPGFHLLGHSFGGNMSAAFASTQPRGLRKLVLASALASKELSVRSIQLRRSELPAEIQQRINEAEARGDFNDPEYKEGLEMMQSRCMYPGLPGMPPEMSQSRKNMAEDNTVYKTMNGPSPLTLGVGSLRKWTVIPRLHQITASTLIYNGENDTSHDMSQIPFFEKIPRVRWRTFAGAGHMIHLGTKEQRREVLKLVGEFLIRKEEEL